MNMRLQRNIPIHTFKNVYSAILKLYQWHFEFEFSSTVNLAEN